MASIRLLVNFALLAVLGSGAAEASAPSSGSIIRMVAATEKIGLQNGAIWHDSQGNQIEAHGGTILKIAGVYHWYGASKKLPKDPVTGRGCGFGCSMHVRLYTSTDLLNWSFVTTVFNASEIVIDPDLKPYAPAPPFRIERPKVIFNAATSRYVLVFHCEDGPYKVGLRGVASSASATGPFTWVGAARANGLFSMDMTEFIDPNDPDRAAYHVRTARVQPVPNIQWTVGSRLTADYLSIAPGPICFNTSTHTEAPAVLYHGGAYYIFGSHLTGLGANPARLLRCKARVLSECCTPLGAPTKWEDLGNPAVGPGTNPEGQGPEVTFNSQSTAVVPLTGEPSGVVALWMGDVWEPDPKLAPGRSNYNATYAWFNVVASAPANASAPNLTFKWADEYVPGAP